MGKSTNIKYQVIILPLFIIHSIYAQTKLRNYANTGFGIYAPLNSVSNNIDLGNCVTLNLEAELTKRSIARFSIDTYRIPLVKETNFNTAIIRSNTKANITAIGLQYGLHFISSKWNFYSCVGASLCFIDEPDFTISNNAFVSINSKTLTRVALTVSPGIKYHIADTFILFAELQNMSFFYKNNNRNVLSGSGLILGISTKI